MILNRRINNEKISLKKVAEKPSVFSLQIFSVKITTYSRFMKSNVSVLLVDKFT